MIVTLEGSPEGLKRLQALFQSGELTEVLGIPVEDVQLIDAETLEEDKKPEIDKKLRLIKEIRSQGASDRDLSGANLSQANLRGAELI